MFKRKTLNHKYKSIPCERSGIKFPSKLERSCYDTLMEIKKKNEIIFILRQIPFDLPGGYIHRVDYCAFTDKSVIFIEAKGRDLPMGKLKRKQVEEIYGITIFLANKASDIYKIIEENK
jgi:hypothetical protein